VYELHRCTHTGVHILFDLLTLGVLLLSGPVGRLRDAEDALTKAALLLPACSVCRHNTTVPSERGPSSVGGNAPSGVQLQHVCATM
jgi:hypothetical protein